MRVIVLLASLIVAGCNIASDDPESDNSGLSETTAATPRQVSAAELAHVIGEECPTVSRSEYKGKADDQVFYAAQCERESFLVSIKADGSTEIMECSIAAMMKISCWEDWYDETGAPKN